MSRAATISGARAYELELECGIYLRGAKRYAQDDPNAEVHIKNPGHFALDLKAPAIIERTKACLCGLKL